MSSSLAAIEKQVAERAKADRRRLAAARAKADEQLGARLRALVAPDAARPEQIERAAAWLTTQEETKRRADHGHEHRDASDSEQS